MSTKYRFAEKEAVYFTTSTVVGWADVFTRDIYRDILLDSIRFCQQNQGLAIHAWVLMTNHLHLICSFHGKQEPALVLKNMKSFTAMKLIDAVIKNPKESRREYLLNLFEAEGKKSNSNFRFKFWEHENHPIQLDSDIVFNQKINYLHWNPVTAGFVTDPWYWKYSSAIDYMTKEKGLLDLVMLE
jgi:putative transposase